jgi:hypothetical protein
MVKLQLDIMRSIAHMSSQRGANFIMQQNILDAFQTMWGPFPEPVMLIQKDRTILAVNDLARTAGVPAGVKCFSLNPEEGKTNCTRCKANVALREQRTVCTEEMQNGKRIIGYWMPLKEEKEVYVHFGIGCAEAMGVQAGIKATCAEELVQL